MKKYITLIFFVLIATISFAQTAYVAAPSGLKLRKTADAKGEVIKTLTFGAKLAYIADAKPKVAHKTKEAEGFYLNGFWQKVVAGTDTGYVFDAFLLPFEQETDALQKNYEEKYLKDCKPEEFSFFERVFKPLDAPYDIIKHDPIDSIYVAYAKEKKSKFCSVGFTQKFTEGITFTYHRKPEKSSNMVVIFTNHNINFVYAMVLSYTTYHNYGEALTISYKNNTIEIEPSGGGCGSSIKIASKKIVWDMWCGC
jgi:hypothetical protein